MTTKRAVDEKGTGLGQVRADLKHLLLELKGGKPSEETMNRTRELLKNVDATTLGIVEQELINEGISHEEIRGSLCDVHLEVMKDDLVSKKIQVQAPHPIHTFMEEHKIILETLEKVKSLVGGFKSASEFAQIRERIPELKDAAHHLVEAESHHQREEEVLFPRLEARGISEPPRVMRMDHADLRPKKKELHDLASAAEDHDFEDFKKKAIELGEYLAANLGSHIFKEDNILYQIALQVLEPKEWDEVKRECDAIGYCCFTPEQSHCSSPAVEAAAVEGRAAQEGAAPQAAVRASAARKPSANGVSTQEETGDDAGRNVVELDLRPMPPFQRHERIFSMWSELKPGETLKITNDHDPKPLHYQFEAEYTDQYKWEYEQSGPVDWVVKLTRL